MNKCILCTAFLLILSVLCGCGAEQSIRRTEEGLYSYDNSLYKNDGEIFLSEKELEYVELIEEFPQGIRGAEWYTGVSRYANWLLLELDENQCLPGLEGHRYFLLISNAEEGRKENDIGDGVQPWIYYSGMKYQYEGSTASENIIGDMEVLGMIQIVSAEISDQEDTDDFQTNLAALKGHFVYRNNGKIVISADGGKTYLIFSQM